MESQAVQSTQNIPIPSQNDSQSSQNKNHLTWIPNIETVLLEKLFPQSRIGKHSDQSWKRETWEAVYQHIQLTYSSPVTILIDQLKNKETIYHSRFKEFVFLESTLVLGSKIDVLQLLILYGIA